MVSSGGGFSMGPGLVSLASSMAGEVVDSTCGFPMSQSLASGMALSKSLWMSYLLKVMYLPMHFLNSTTLI